MKWLQMACIMALGIQSIWAQEKMVIEGAVVVGNSESGAPVPGTIRFNTSTNDFEGYTGSTWKSMTRLADSPSAEWVEDFEGNRYDIVKIGSQIWMAENLRSTRFNDGSTINFLNPLTFQLFTHQWVYDNDIANEEIYGRLYDWSAVDSDKLCPVGWSIPTIDQWRELIFHIGDTADGGLLKEAGTEYWNTPNHGANNLTRFGARGAGSYRIDDGTFLSLKETTQWWSSTIRQDIGRHSSAALRNFDSNMVFPASSTSSNPFAISVRCIKD